MERINNENKKDWTILLVGFLSASKLFLNSLGIDVLSDEMINSGVDMVSFGVAIWAIWKNTYVSSKGVKQKEVLKNSDLM